LKTAGVLKNPRARFAIAVVLVLAGFFTQHRVVQLDPEVFPLNSLRSLQGLAHYLLGNYQAASASYRDHFGAAHKQYGLSTNDEQLSLLLEKNYKKAQLRAKGSS
jgi:hypothetical protein